jgi:hypothetical protein
VAKLVQKKYIWQIKMEVFFAFLDNLEFGIYFKTGKKSPLPNYQQYGQCSTR